MTPGVRSFILFTLVVVDGKKIEGYPLRSISDYVAMLTLSQVRLSEGCGELPSILDLMAVACSREKPQSITAADLAYLRALNTVGQEVNYFNADKSDRIQNEEATRESINGAPEGYRIGRPRTVATDEAQQNTAQRRSTNSSTDGESPARRRTLPRPSPVYLSARDRLEAPA